MRKLLSTNLPVRQNELLQDRYGSSQWKSSCALINLVLALEDVKRFSNAAFISWLSAVCVTPEQMAQVVSLSNQESNMQLLSQLLCLLGFEPESLNHGDLQTACALSDTCAQACWVFYAQQRIIDWSRLSTGGPWANDARAQFLMECLRQLPDDLLCLTALDIRQAQEVFIRILQERRRFLPANFLSETLLLVEGQTEELLLPNLCLAAGVDLDANAVAILACGGARQVYRKYCVLKEWWRLPLVVVLDGDAGDQISLMELALRSGDRLLTIDGGEIEDIFDEQYLLLALNDYAQQQGLSGVITLADLKGSLKRTHILDQWWRQQTGDDFDKVGFAHAIIKRGMPPDKIPVDIYNLAAVLAELKES